ncbi:MAG TPA: sigma-70 family RNA polymerase sigma factor [Ilumatobacteraceae bacterium]|nr:sigma-70 family RNA polymerase sigma factor [Ilumatobacteraceae bacterium]
MPETRTDAQLVTAYTAGDRGALAGIYDRFAAGLYDTAAAMLRDRHEAADAMQDVFLIAAERMGQLREPERLKPWLYAILRNEVYRRSKKRGRMLPTDFSAMGSPEVAAPTAPDADGEALSAAELGELVRSAACGLDERDQLVLELSVRQGLQGSDLAAALGISAEQSYTLVHRMRERVEKSLGALVVARAGRRDCKDLADVLQGWNGEFTVLIRKRVARHIENCETCERTRKKAAPIALLGAAPAFAAPIALRDQILTKAGMPGAAPAHAYTFDADGGFPRLLRSIRLPVAVAAVVAAVLIGIGGGAIVAANSRDDATSTPSTAVVTLPATTESIPPATTQPAATSTSSSSTTTSTSTTTTTTTTTTIPSTTIPATVPPAPGTLSLSLTTLDLGADRVSDSFTVTNSGGLPITWSVNGSTFPFTLINGGGTLQPGASQVVTVALNRNSLEEGDVRAQALLAGPDGAVKKVTLLARTEHAPELTLTDGPSGTLLACQWSPPNIYVEYTDESAIVIPATVEWTGALTGASDLADRVGIAVYGEMSIVSPPVGAYSYTVYVSDVRGNVTTVEGFFTVISC